MCWQVAAVATIWIAAACASEQKPSVSIALKEQANVAETVVRLRDIAEVKALTPDAGKIIAGLLELPVAPSPLPRYRRIITAGEVATKLAQAGWRSGDFVLEGSKQVVITRSGRAVTAAEIEEALQKTFKTPVKLLIKPPVLIVPEGELTVQADMPSSPRTVLLVTLLVNGKPVATLKLLVQLSETTETRGFQISSSSISRTTNFPVRRRQTVRLVARVGNVVVEARGTALQDGKLGDKVMVEVEWTKTPLKGIVTGEREVTVSVW